MSNDDEWITVSEAAKLSGYDEEHITRLCRQGRITARKFATVWQVNKTSLSEYMARAEKIGNKRGPKPKN